MNISNLSDISGASPTSLAQKNTPLADVQKAKQVERSQDQKLSMKEITEVLQQANDAMKANSSNLKFSLDPDSGQTVVQVIDLETQKVLKQIPTVEMLKLAKALEKMQGVLVSKQV